MAAVDVKAFVEELTIPQLKDINPTDPDTKT